MVGLLTLYLAAGINARTIIQSVRRHTCKTITVLHSGSLSVDMYGRCGDVEVKEFTSKRRLPAHVADQSLPALLTIDRQHNNTISPRSRTIATCQ